MIHNAKLPAYIKRELAEILADVRKMEAAVPEMLEALRAIYINLEGYCADPALLSRHVRAAVDKTEGRTL